MRGLERWLSGTRALSAPPEHPGLIPSTLQLTTTWDSSSRGSCASDFLEHQAQVHSAHVYYVCVYVYAGKTFIHIKISK